MSVRYINPCRCGNTVKVQFICGCKPSVIGLVKNPFVSSFPTYYIYCSQCGNSIAIRVMHSDENETCRRKLLTEWNRTASCNPPYACFKCPHSDCQRTENPKKGGFPTKGELQFVMTACNDIIDDDPS